MFFLLLGKIRGLRKLGIHYFHRSDLPKALQCFKDALSMNSKICGENSINDTMGTLCLNFAFTAVVMGKLNLAKEYYIKAVTIYRTISLTENTCGSSVVSGLYYLSLICETLGEHDEALKHSEEAREFAKDTGIKVRVVEAGELAKSLPKDDSLCLPSKSEMLKFMKTSFANRS